MPLPVIPKPQSIETRSGHVELSKLKSVRVSPFEKGSPLNKIGKQLIDHLAAAGVQGLPLLPRTESVNGEGSIHLSIDPSLNKDNPEAYRLVISESGVTICGQTHAGVFYGVQTLVQLIQDAVKNARPRRTLPALQIVDAPRFPWRGFMLDSARHFQTVAQVKQMIDKIAALKLNRLHWHLADDQGWRFEVKSHPKLTTHGAWRGEGKNRYGGFYTQEQLKDIAAYAQDRCIKIIPEIDMPGHSNAAIFAYPELSCTGVPIDACDDGALDSYTRNDGRRLFCAGRDSVLAFLKDVLREVAEVFEPQFIHLGGDERPADIWSACPRCQERMKSLGLETEDELELWFASQVAAYVHDELKVQTIGWGDNLKKAGMPKDQIVQGWLEGQTEMAASQGRTTLNSFHEWVYLDYPPTDEARVGKPDWMPVLPIERVYQFEPIPDGLTDEQASLILGSEAPAWTEYLPTFADLVKQAIPRLRAFSEVLWSAKKLRDFDDFTARARRMEQGPAPLPKPVIPGVKNTQNEQKTLTNPAARS